MVFALFVSLFRFVEGVWVDELASDFGPAGAGRDAF